MKIRKTQTQAQKKTALKLAQEARKRQIEKHFNNELSFSDKVNIALLKAQATLINTKLKLKKWAK